jgi:hypothetical protein
MRLKALFSLALSLCMTLAAIKNLRAEDSCAAKVKADLDAVEQEIPSVKKGDGKTANAIINKINVIKAAINKCNLALPEVKEQGKRSVYLDGWVRAQALGQPKPEKPEAKPESNEPDENTQKAQGRARYHRTRSLIVETRRCRVGQGTGRAHQCSPRYPEQGD